MQQPRHSWLKRGYLCAALGFIPRGEKPVMQLVDEVRQSRRLPQPAVARMIRMTAGVSQERIAREIGVHRMTIARWESGERRPRGEPRLRYIELLDALRGEVV